MNGSVIDTNVIIRMLNNDKTVIRLLDGVQQAYLPVIVAGELMYGAYKSARKKENLELFRRVISEFEILLVNNEISNSYALIKAELAKIGKPVPENDL